MSPEWLIAISECKLNQLPQCSLMVPLPVPLSCSLCGFPTSSSLSSNIPSTPYTHVSRLPWLLANRRKSLFAITPSSSFHSINIPYLCNVKSGVRVGGKETPDFSETNPSTSLSFPQSPCSILVSSLSRIFNLLLATDLVLSAYKPDTISCRVVLS